MKTTHSNQAAVPMLRYSVVRMVNEVNAWMRTFDDRLMQAWAMPESVGRDHHMRALVNQWVALRDWVADGVYIEDDWNALCDSAFALVGAFDVWLEEQAVSHGR